MPGNSMNHIIDLICVIVNFGQGSKILHAVKECGCTGATVLIGKGTINNRFLDFIGLSDQRKEIIYIITERETGRRTLENLNRIFEFEKPNHGIAFTMQINTVINANRCEGESADTNGGAVYMYKLISVIVDRGKAEDVISAATKAGSKGGTIIHGRGSGIHETQKVFNMEIEPEKEIVLILARSEKTEGIVKSINNDMQIEKPGNGIIFVQNVDKTYGLYE
jgi:nitrogen regulatory protein PII